MNINFISVPQDVFNDSLRRAAEFQPHIRQAGSPHWLTWASGDGAIHAERSHTHSKLDTKKLCCDGSTYMLTTETPGGAEALNIHNVCRVKQHCVHFLTLLYF